MTEKSVSDCSDYFDEKAHQVEPGVLTAFGITIRSRYSKASELIEMLAFAQKAALADVAGLVEEVFYDSKACVCSFKFTQNISFGEVGERKLFTAAIESIGQFDWFDTMHHRGEDDD